MRINIDAAVIESGLAADGVGPDELARVVDYGRFADAARRIVGAGHIRLAETLAERLAAACLDDLRVVSVRVQVEKLDVFPEAASVGVTVMRVRD